MKKSNFFDCLAVQVAGGASVKAAAETSGCSPQTGYNISATPEFRQRVATLRTEVVAAAVGKLSDAAAQACDTMRELLDASNQPGVRLNAAKAILSALGPMTEFGELRTRLDAIEQQTLRVHHGA
jgi:hypothetical protein